MSCPLVLRSLFSLLQSSHVQALCVGSARALAGEMVRLRRIRIDNYITIGGQRQLLSAKLITSITQWQTEQKCLTNSNPLVVRHFMFSYYLRM